MRFSFVALLVVALACSKSEPKGDTPSETGATPAAVAEAEAPPAQKAPPAAPAPSPETAPVVTLVEAGKPPLRKLRRSFKAGQKETMSLEAGERIRMKGGGWNVEHITLALLQTIDVETKAVSKNGVADVTLTIVDAKEVEGSVEKPTTKQMNPTGVTGSYKINTLGVVTDLNLVPPPDNPKVQKTFLDSARNKLRWMAPPFPNEPVGVGANWKVVTEVNEFLTRMTEEATVELVERTDSGIVLRFEVKSTGVKEHDFTPPQTITIDLETGGRAKIAPAKVVPRSSSLEQKNVQTASIEGMPEKGVIQTLELTTAIESK